ncbi:MAG TPA: EAL domain-containing protein [Kofleriaceae bacterium]|nr:EAL domain-containing protein [Kofleriaceae bacterium]
MGDSASWVRDEGRPIPEDAPWVAIACANDTARAWLAKRIAEHAHARAAASADELLAILDGATRPSLLVIDLDGIGAEATQLLWQLARRCPLAPRLLMATPGTRAHHDAQAFAEVGDLLLDRPCSLGQIQIALQHLLGAVLLAVPPPRGAIEIPAPVAARVDQVWRAGRVSSCWCIDLSHARRALGLAWNDGVAEVVAGVLARTLSEVFPGLVEVLRMAPIEPAAYALVVAHAPARGGLAAVATRVEEALAEALAPAAQGDPNLRVVVTASEIVPVTRAQVAPRLAAAIAAARADSSERLQSALASDRMQLIATLDQGLRFAFQPIVDLANGELFAYEARARQTWPSELGSFHDAAWLAGAIGLGARFDQEVVRGALAMALDLGPHHRLYVRVSPHWLRDPRHVYRAHEWAKKSRLVPAQIVFELDELTELRGAVALRDLLAPLCEAGFGVAITCRDGGVVTLADLTTLNPDFLRLPSSWVRGLGRSRVRRELVAAVVRLARALDVVVLASGADTVEDLAALYELGVRYCKGRVFGRPWDTFAVPRPRGLAQLEAIWCGEVAAPPPGAASFDDESGEVSTALRPTFKPRLSEDSQPAAILRDLIAPVPEPIPLGELVAQVDAAFDNV